MPFYFFGQFTLVNGLELGGFISAVFTTPAAAGFAVDLLVTLVVLWIFISHERFKLSAPSPILYIVINQLVGLSCALLACLYARSEDRLRVNKIHKHFASGGLNRKRFVAKLSLNGLYYLYLQDVQCPNLTSNPSIQY